MVCLDSLRYPIFTFLSFSSLKMYKRNKRQCHSFQIHPSDHSYVGMSPSSKMTNRLFYPGSNTISSFTGLPGTGKLSLSLSTCVMSTDIQYKVIEDSKCGENRGRCWRSTHPWSCLYQFQGPSSEIPAYVMLPIRTPSRSDQSTSLEPRTGWDCLLRTSPLPLTTLLS